MYSSVDRGYIVWDASDDDDDGNRESVCVFFSMLSYTRGKKSFEVHRKLSLHSLISLQPERRS